MFQTCKTASKSASAMKRSVLVATLAVMAAGLPFGSDAKAADPVELTQAQQTLLELQLKERYSCIFEKILFAREIEIGGTRQLEGRIRCTDEREVDFAQSSPNQKFQLNLCQPTVC